MSSSESESEETSAAVMRLSSMGEEISIENYQISKDAIRYVNTFGAGFSSDIKVELQIYSFHLIQSMMQQQEVFL
jgi:hypothetical protein